MNICQVIFWTILDIFKGKLTKFEPILSVLTIYANYALNYRLSCSLFPLCYWCTTSCPWWNEGFISLRRDRLEGIEGS